VAVAGAVARGRVDRHDLAVRVLGLEHEVLPAEGGRLQTLAVAGQLADEGGGRRAVVDEEID
jgi:hypothetical protein